MPTWDSVSVTAGTYSPIVSPPSSGVPYVFVFVVSSTATFNSSIVSAPLTVTKRFEFTSGNQKIGVFEGVSNNSGFIVMPAFATGGVEANAVYVFGNITLGRTVSPLIAAAYCAAQGHTPVASTTTDGVDITPPHGSGRFVNFIAGIVSSGTLAPNSSTNGGWLNLVTDAAYASNRGIVDVRQQNADNAGTSPIEHDQPWGGSIGPNPEAIELMFWLAPANTTPNVPTSVQRTGDTSDNTPNFSAAVQDADFEFSEQAKVRFSILNSGLVEVGTVDSSFVSAAGTVTAEYTSALPVGNYFVRAKAIDDGAAESAYSANVAFSVTTLAQKDLNVLYNTKQEVTKDLDVRYDTLSLSTTNKDLEIKYNTTVADPTPAQKDLEFLYNVEIGWDVIESTDTIWEMIEV